jgi:hypothetical protein
LLSRNHDNHNNENITSLAVHRYANNPVLLVTSSIGGRTDNFRSNRLYTNDMLVCTHSALQEIQIEVTKCTDFIDIKAQEATSEPWAAGSL